MTESAPQTIDKQNLIEAVPEGMGEIIGALSGLELQTLLSGIDSTKSQENIEEFIGCFNNLKARLLEIDDYELENFEQDLGDTIKSFKSILPKTFASQIDTALNKVSTIDATKWKAIKQKYKETMDLAKAKEEARELAEKESRTLTLEQKMFLNSDVNFGIVKLIALAKADGGTDEAQLEKFKTLLTDKVFDYAEKVKRDKDKIIDGLTATDQVGQEKAMLENLYKGKDGKSLLKFTQNSGVGKTADFVGDGLGSLFGNLAGGGMPLISKDPILSSIFKKPEDKKLFYTAGNAGALKKLIEEKIDGLFKENKYGEPLTIGDLEKSYFDMGTKQDILAGAKGKEGKKIARFLKEKHETVTRSYRHKEDSKGIKWQDKYDEYLRETGFAAVDFPEWMEQQFRDKKIGAMEYYINKIKDLFFGVLESLGVNWFDDDKTDAQKNKFAEQYSQALGESDETEEPNEPISINQSIDKFANYQAFRDSFAEQEHVYVFVEGAPVDLMEKNEKIKLPDDFDFTYINSLVKGDPAFKKLFSRKLNNALDLEDLDFMASHDGKSEKVNIRMDKGKVNFSVDKEWKKKMATTLGVSVGAVGVWFLPLIASVPALGGGVLGGSYFNNGLSKLTEGDGLSVKYDKLSKEELSNTILFLKELKDLEPNDIKLSELLRKEDQAFFDKDLNFKNVPQKMLKFDKETKKFEMCGSLRSLTKYMRKEEIDKNLTEGELVLLNKYFEHSGEFETLGFKKDNYIWYVLGEEKVYMNDEKNDQPEKFLQVDGGGDDMSDDNFENLEALLKYAGEL